MFNPEVKWQYVSYALSASSSQNLKKYEDGIVNRFNRTARTEKDMGKDILLMDADEIICLLKEHLKGGKDYQYSTISTLKAYYEWGIANKFSTFKENCFNGIKVSDVDISASYADSMLKDEDDLIKCLDNILDDISNDTIENIYRCIMFLLFWGISKDDVWYLKETDVNLKTKTIQYKSREIEMSDYLFSLVKHLLQTDKIMKDGKQSSGYGIDVIRQGYLLSNSRHYDTEEARKRMRGTYGVSISKILANCERALTYTTVAASGVFYRMYIKEKDTGEIDCLEYLRARRNQLSTISSPDRVKEKCRHEYNTWKKAFNL